MVSNMLCAQRLRTCWGPALPASSAWRSRNLLYTRISRGSSEFEGVGGDKDMQEALMQQLRVQVDTQTLKEEIREDLKGKVEDLKQIGEDLISQLDAELGIEKFRAELESTQVLSDANDKFNELEQQVQQIKAQIKADQEDLRAFEAASASARSQGLFFRNLYQPSADEEDQHSSSGNPAASDGKGSKHKMATPGAVDPAVRQAAAVVTASAQAEVSSPFRMYLFSYMALVLGLVVVQDLTTSEPQYALDGLYGVLGLLLGINALYEKQVLMRTVRQQQQMQEDSAGNVQQRVSSSSSSSGSSDHETERKS